LASYDAASNPRKFVRDTESGFESNFRLGDARALAFLSLPNGWHHERLWPSALAAAELLLVVPWSSPALLQPLNRFWTKFGLLLHRIANPIVMGLRFYGTILPTGLVMRPRGGDLLRLKREPDAESYWICAHAGASLEYRPMLLGAVLQATGNASPGAIPAKGRYTAVDLGRFARRYNVPLIINPNFPINTLNLMRCITGVQLRSPDSFLGFVKLVFDALWVRELNLGDDDVLARLLRQGGFDPAQVLGWASSDAVKTALRGTTDEAVRRGVFGAPSVFVDEVLYFGQDRLDFVREALHDQ